MLKHFLRVYHTVRYIKFIQLFYQIWYRIKNRFLSVHWYKDFESNNICSFQIRVDIILQTGYQEYRADNRFYFIGLHHKFDNQIDWNYAGHGKLWNYNLQYFSYLLDENLDSAEREKLLQQFSKALINREVRPEPYPVSLRIVNTLLFHNRYPITNREILNALFLQVSFLEHNLEYHLLANHLLENAFALYIASLFLNNKRLYKKAALLLKDQIEEQILPDGGHYECSPMYQSILLSKLYLCIEVASHSKSVTSSELSYLKSKAEQMLGWMNAYSFPDGTWALMNDAAEGIAPATYQLNEAAKYLKLIPQKANLSDSGFRKLEGNNWEVIIKTGNVQPSFQPGHVHADMLSFCLWYKGKQVIVDSGTSTYTISAQRSKERSTVVHNTVSVAGFNQSDVWGGFRVGKRATCQVIVDGSDQLEAVVNGYEGTSIQHKRTFLAQSNHLLIKDEVSGNENTLEKCSGSLQLANGIFVESTETAMHCTNFSVEASGTKLKQVPSVFANTFNVLQPAFRIEYPIVKNTELRFHFL